MPEFVAGVIGSTYFLAFSHLLMEPDYRARYGQSYHSARRRICTSVASTMLLASGYGDDDGSAAENVEDVGFTFGVELTDDENAATVGGDPSDVSSDVGQMSSESDLDVDVISNYDSPDDSTYSLSSDSDSCVNDNIDKSCIAVELAEWVARYNVPQIAVGGLLSILKPYHPSLPVDPRTLMKTPRNYEFKEIVCADGQLGHYYHFGIAAGIVDLELQMYAVSNNTLMLQFNFDGLPLFKSSSMEFWPILCAVKDHENFKPFAVGLYCGRKKPSDVSDYVAEFVAELQLLLETGVTCNDTRFMVHIDCFVCDAPARAFIKNVKGHTGYHGCEKCVQEGVYVNGRMTFPETDARLRTDEDLKRMTDEDHHRGPSPLSVLPIGLVTGFVYDYMHLVCLGVVRKLLKFWQGGALRSGENVASRLSSGDLKLLSERLVKLSSCIPQEFARWPRAVSEVDRWKATEFRLFLLYTGPVTLPGILPQSVYDHFMLLSVGITLLVSPAYCQLYNEYAHSLLVSFVQLASTLYGNDFLVYNVHGLVHLANDVKRHGSLDGFSSFPFENELKNMKQLVRKAGNPLAQCVRRLTEQRRFSSCKKISSGDCIEPTAEHHSGPVPAGFEEAVQFRKLTFGKFKVNVNRSPSDCCVAICGVGPVVVVNVLSWSGSLYVVCKRFKSLTDVFTYPLASSSIGIFRAARMYKQLFVFPVSHILSKCVCFPASDTSQSHSASHHYNIFPVVHTVIAR